jgi:hypothetical protein
MPKISKNQSSHAKRLDLSSPICGLTSCHRSQPNPPVGQTSSQQPSKTRFGTSWATRVVVTSGPKSKCKPQSRAAMRAKYTLGHGHFSEWMPQVMDKVWSCGEETMQEPRRKRMAGSSVLNKRLSLCKGRYMIVSRGHSSIQHDALRATLIRHIASCPLYEHSSCLCHWPVRDVLSPISRHLGRLRRHYLGRNHAARDIVVRHRT